MGYSAKITRGGNKKRVNQGRLEAKLKAQGMKEHTMTTKETVAAKQALKERSQAISERLKSLAQQNQKQQPAAPQKPTAIVRMASKPAKSAEKKK